MRIRQVPTDFSHTVERSCQKKQNIADAMKLMRRGGPKTKIRKPRMPKTDPNPAADKFKNRVNK